MANDKKMNVQRDFISDATAEKLGGIKVGGYFNIDENGHLLLVDLPAATSAKIGGVIVGGNIAVNELGVISIPLADYLTAGVVRAGVGFNIDENGTMSVDVSGKEDVANKITDIVAYKDSDEAYGGAKAVYDFVTDAINAAHNGNFEGKGYWYGKVTTDFVPPAPQDLTDLDETVNRSKINYFDFTTNTPYEPTEDLTGWVALEPVVVGDKEIVRITKQFWDTNEAGYPGTAEYSEATNSWTYFPAKSGRPDGYSITIRGADGAWQVAAWILEKVGYVDTGKSVSLAINSAINNYALTANNSIYQVMEEQVGGNTLIINLEPQTTIYTGTFTETSSTDHLSTVYLNINTADIDTDKVFTFEVLLDLRGTAGNITKVVPGDVDGQTLYDVAWVDDTDGEFDSGMGFVLVVLRKIKGQWIGNIQATWGSNNDAAEG